jgi:hypothetical protein
LVFPTIGQGGPQWALTAEQVGEWRVLFPGLDILAEARTALAWVTADTGRRKTAGGMKRFLVAWFTRTVNRGGARTTAAKKPGLTGAIPADKQALYDAGVIR